MSEPHSHPAPEEGKKHGDALADLVDESSIGSSPTHREDPVPPPEDGGHAHSAAAHLGSSAQPHTKPAGNLRQGSHPGALREPPMVVQRVGKQHR